MQQINAAGAGVNDGERASGLEWLVTNGLGGFASGTVAGLNTRRYHATLLAAPRVETRCVLVAQVQEEFTGQGETWQLGAAHYLDVVHPQGYRHLLGFGLYPYPTWVYAVGGYVMAKSLVMVRGRNATALKYHLLSGPGPAEILLRPLVAARDYHATRRESPEAFRVSYNAPWLRVAAAAAVPATLLAAPQPAQITGYWYRNTRYPMEQERGLDWEEDLFAPGEWRLPLAPGGAAWLLACAEESDVPVDPAQWVDEAFAVAAERPRLLLARAGNPKGYEAQLVAAADAFVIQREESASVIAGYPWFTDWGRDAMIALPGLFLVTGRSAEAVGVLRTFARAEKDGLIPNRFPDRTAEPEYNTVDASLWFIYACERYVSHTGDEDGMAELWPTVKAIVAGYRNGTHFGIGVDERGLVRAGESGMQLTWMDAKVDGWVVTPRAGYPVEISALWHNALCSAAQLGRYIDPEFAARCRAWAKETAGSFLPAFWLPAHGYLADVLADDGTPDGSLRPNQLLAVSLPYPVLSGEHARAVVDRVWQHLYTPMGLRSLAPYEADYHGSYAGNQVSRDSAYHRGTVWSWLIGPFISAYLRVYGHSRTTENTARMLIAPLLHHLCDAGLGQVSEVFGGDPPYKPGGCFAQAWSVAELLRLWVDEFNRQPLAVSEWGQN